MMNFRISDQAKADLNEIWMHIAVDNLEAADRLIEAMVDEFELLAFSPGIGRSRDDLGQGLRGMPISSYMIFYRKSERDIEIIRVISNYRDYPSLL